MLKESAPIPARKTLTLWFLWQGRSAENLKLSEPRTTRPCCAFQHLRRWTCRASHQKTLPNTDASDQNTHTDTPTQDSRRSEPLTQCLSLPPRLAHCANDARRGVSSTKRSNLRENAHSKIRLPKFWTRRRKITTLDFLKREINVWNHFNPNRSACQNP